MVISTRHYPFFIAFFILISEPTYSQITFSNFSETLTAREEGEKYFISDKPVLLKDIIVKTDKSLTAESFLSLSNLISDVRGLYSARDFEYFLLQVEGPLNAELLELLQATSGVLLAQPDILQLNSRGALRSQPGDDARGKPEKYAILVGQEDNKGTGVKVAIIDDGFDLSHPEFSDLKVIHGVDVESNTSDPLPKLSGDSHGTRVLGVLAAKRDNSVVDGIAPDADYVLVRQTSTWTSKTIMGFQTIKRLDVDIVNCSWNSYWLIEPVRDVIYDLINTGRNGRGLPVIFASGNQGVQLLKHQIEASIEPALVIGALGKDKQIRRNSNWGDSVDFFMPGEKALTTRNGGGYVNFSGTSLAAAFATGEITRLLSSKPELTLTEIVTILEKNADFNSNMVH